MSPKASWLLYAAILIPGSVVVNVVVKELLKEWELRSVQRLPFYIPAESNWKVSRRDGTLIHEIKLNVDKAEISAATLRAFPEVKKQQVVENVCSHAGLSELLKRGAVTEHEYLDRYGKWMATLVVRAGDCT